MRGSLLSVCLCAILGVVGMGSAAAKPGTISECGAILNEAGNYKLGADLTACPGFAITIAASGVSLNLRNHSITCDREDGRRDVGVEVLGVTDVHIRNGRISNCDAGIELLQTRDSKVNNMELTDNLLDPLLGGGFGLVTFQAVNNHINGNTASRNNTAGIELFFSSGNKINGNTASENFRSDDVPFPNFGIGIGVAFSNENEIIGNQTNNNTDAGIALANGSTGNIVRGNTANDNENYGIGMFSREDFQAPLAFGNLVQANRAIGNGRADLLEARFDPFGNPREEVQPDCVNTFKSNTYITRIAPDLCF